MGNIQDGYSVARHIPDNFLNPVPIELIHIRVNFIHHHNLWRKQLDAEKFQDIAHRVGNLADLPVHIALQPIIL